MDKEISLEEAFSQIETMIQRLDDETISLEESFKIYSEGMELLHFCNDSIDKVEKKVLKMNESGELDEF